jgi:hypothetical protein
MQSASAFILIVLRSNVDLWDILARRKHLTTETDLAGSEHGGSWFTELHITGPHSHHCLDIFAAS